MSSGVLNAAKIDIEREAIRPRPHIAPQVSEYPFELVDDRQFEILTHALAEAEASRGKAAFDRASLLGYGADKGRDVVLLKGERVVGVIQCKRMRNRLSLDAVLVEICKFALFAVRDLTLTPSVPNFEYQLWTAKDVAEAVRTFFVSPEAGLARVASTLPIILKKAREGAPASLTPASEAERNANDASALRLIAGLKFKHVGPVSIGRRLDDNPSIRRWFFRSPKDGPRKAEVNEVDRLMRAVRQQQLEEYVASGRAGSAPYVQPRPLTEGFADFLASSSKLFVLTGGTGTGKSTWAARLLEAPPAAFSVYVVRVEDILANDTSLLDTMARTLRLHGLGGTPAHELDQAVRDWLDSANQIVIVDGLDRVSHSAASGLSSWLGHTVALNRALSVRFVLTSRPEAWRTIEATSELGNSIYSDGNQTSRRSGSLRLGELSAVDLSEMLQAYGIAPNDAPKATWTPGLIAEWAGQSAEGRGRAIARSDILRNSAIKLRDDVVAAGGLGAVSASRLLIQLGRALLASPDGRIRLDSLGRDGNEVTAAGLDELVRRDAVHLDESSVRMGSDDLAEYLMGEVLEFDQAIEELMHGRSDALFIGAIAIAISNIERESKAEAHAAIAKLIDHTNNKVGVFIDAACRALLDLRDPAAATAIFQRLIEYWNRISFAVYATALPSFFLDLRIAAIHRFDILLPLALSDDQDDWREKYWLGEVHGRIASAYATTVQALVRAHAAELVNRLIALSLNDHDPCHFIAMPLLYDSARADPSATLESAWTAALDHGPRIIERLSHGVPIEVAGFLRRVAGRSPRGDEIAVKILGYIIEVRETLSEEPAAIAAPIAAAARVLRTHVRIPAAEPTFIIAELLDANDETLQARLLTLWPLVRWSEFWTAITVLGPARRGCLVRLIEGSDPQHSGLGLLGAMPPFAVPCADWPSIIPSIAIAISSGGELARDSALMIETWLYVTTEAADLAILWPVACSIASHPDKRVRSCMLYFAGSPVGENVVERDRAIACAEDLLDLLVEAEDGELLSTLLWKLIESFNERPRPYYHIARLAERLGADKVLAMIDCRSTMTPGGVNLVAEITERLRHRASDCS